jgi:hypothetical protein
MQLNLNLWYVKWFFWSAWVMDHFTKTERKRQFFSRTEKYHDKGTTLCQFIRTLFLGTLIYLSTIALIAYSLFVVLILPFILFPALNIVLSVGLVTMVTTIIIAGVFGLIFGIDKFNEKYEVLKTSKPTKSDEPSFIKTLFAYIKAVKQQVCPLVTFTNNQGGTNV